MICAAVGATGNSQSGNNNPYCLDDETSWVDWRPEDACLDVYEITKAALRLRRDHPALRQRHWFEGRPTIRGGPKDLAWLHPSGREMSNGDWHDDRLGVVGMFVSGSPLRLASPSPAVIEPTSNRPDRLSPTAKTRSAKPATATPIAAKKESGRSAR